MEDMSPLSTTSSSDGVPDLEEVAEVLRQLLESPDISNADRIAASINLGDVLSELADLSGNADGCDEAISRGEDARRLVAAGTDAYLTVYSDLSTFYLTRFELKGAREDLESSLRLIREAVNKTVSGTALSIRLANLTNTLCTSFSTFGRGSDLREAIEAAQRAEALLDVGDTRAKILSNKAKALALRYALRHIVTDIVEAVQLTEEAIACAEDESVRTTCVGNLIGHLVALGERNDTDETVDRGIQEGSQNYLLLQDDPHKACMAHNLSYLYRLKYERVDEHGSPVDGDPANLQQAIDYATEAVNLPGDLATRAMSYDHLSVCLEHAHRKSPGQGYLDMAITHERSAIALLPKDHPSMANFSNHLVSYLWARGGDTDMDEALEICRANATDENAALLERISAGRYGGFILAERKQWSDASQLIAAAVELIGDLARDALQRQDQQHVLSQLTGLSTLAAWTALEASLGPEQAFRTMEKGRGVLMELVIAAKPISTPFRDIPEAKTLLDRCAELHTIVNGSIPTSTIQNISISAITSTRIQAVQELKLKKQELQTLAQQYGLDADRDGTNVLGDDYAVSFVTLKQRCDAIILSRTGFAHLPLPRLRWSEVQDNVKLLIGSERITKLDWSTYYESNERLKILLRWLWDVAVQPILLHLQLLSRTSAKLPRLCWIVSGAMGLMPLHAAGDHSHPGVTPATIDFVVSSYAVSFRSLSWCRQLIARHISQGRRRLENFQAAAIMMPSTPGQHPLSVEKELVAIKSAVERVIELPFPSVARVQEVLPSLNLVHFACHAQSGVGDPSTSSVLLYNEGIEHLSVYDISNLDISNAWLAYLSACQTADLQETDYVDEVIHIAATFQIAGFPQVVGTLWQAEDDVAVSVAEAFYSHPALVQTCRGQLPLHSGTAVVALHEAVKKVRNEDPTLVLSWAQFVIYGA